MDEVEYTTTHEQNYNRVFNAFWADYDGATITAKPLALLGFRVAIDHLHPRFRTVQKELQDAHTELAILESKLRALENEPR